jgi:hypothetical protein
VTGGRAWWLRARALVRPAIALEFAVAVAIVLYAGLRTAGAVWHGAPPAVPVRLSISCTAASPATSCDASAQELEPGRYRIATSAAASTVVINADASQPQRARHLLVRIDKPAAVRLSIRGRSRDDVATLDANDSGRVVASLPDATGFAVTIGPAEGQAPSPMVVAEFGVFADSEGLLTDPRLFFAAIPPLRYANLVLRGVAGLCLFTIVAALFVPPAALRRFGPVTLAAVCLSLCFLDLSVLFSPYFARDLRTFYAGGPLTEPAGANLNGGLHQGMRLLQGHGLTTRDGIVPWERMPGYGLFCAASGALFGHRSLVDVALSTVLLQVLFYAAAVGIFAAVAMRLFAPAAVWAVGLLIAWLPKQLGFTQVDAIIAPVSLLVLSALALRVDRMRRGAVPIRVDALVHASFALWFLMRPDVLPGWAVVSIALHARQRRRLLVPVACFLAVGSGWGAYKARYTGEFALTTSSAGASLFCGLWEVPSRFRYAQACTDETYFDWIHQHTPFQPQSAAANSFATREVLRFWLTYPGHVIVMLYDKMLQMLNGDLWPGYVTELQASVFRVVPRYPVVISLLTVVAVCLAVGYERGRTALLGWPVWLNAPLFFVMFASLGRFYSAVGIGLLAASVPQLFERAFYDAAARHAARTVVVIACAALFAVSAWPVRSWLLANDALHYWTPVLDPAASALAVFK